MHRIFSNARRNVATLTVKRIRRKFVDVEEGETMATVVMKNDRGGNCVDVQLLEELQYVLSELTERWKLRTVLIRSSVPGVFSTGWDLGAYASWSDEEVAYVASKARELFTAVVKFPIPTVAVVDGAAVGPGAELVISCDFRAGSPRSVFSFPETRLGLIPGIAVTRLPQLIGHRHAKELILTGRQCDGQEAREMGLLDMYGEDPMQMGSRLARTMESGAPLALRAAKLAIEDRAPDRVADYFGMLVTRRDRKEGVRALIEKRKPNYKGA